MIGPLNVAAEYVDKISKGDIPAKITDSLQRRLQRDQEQPQRVRRRVGSAEDGGKLRAAHFQR